jgi:hypothetical protein
MTQRLALDVALDMAQRPLLVRQAQKQPLPDDVLLLIRIAAHSEEDTVWACRTRARSMDEVREAAVMFLQQVLFHPHADNFRIMGLRTTATLEEVHEHRRWLLKWLHPDRNHDKWESQLFKRVVQASAELQKCIPTRAGLPPPALVRPPSRRRRVRPQRMKAAAKAETRSVKVNRYIRRGCYIVASLALITIGWQLWNGPILGQSFAELSSGRGSWLDW